MNTLFEIMLILGLAYTAAIGTLIAFSLFGAAIAVVLTFLSK
jgi:hypothetical protein